MISTMTSSATSAIFSFNGTQIHTVTDDNGETWFSAGDICAVLGYSNDSEAIEKYCREKGTAKRAPHAEGENPGLTYINEGNLYRLIINSREEDAHAFEAKLTEEILPAIRKAGGCATPQDASALSPVQQNALWQIVSQRSGNSDTVHADIWIRFNDHFEIGSYSELPAARFVDAVSFLAALSTNDALPGTRYQYPRAMLDQPHFVAPDDGKACLSLSMLSDLAQFESPLMSLLNQLGSDGHDISAPLDEAVAMRAAMQQTDKVLDEIRLIALKAKSGRL
ncbi:MAG: BRO family protein [Candidatus Nitrotoga sp.]|nr:BRO family protein [Candidatus Nitrotoga sp.]MDO9447867.1 BRO family protein [Candidatus Nitrotoga sp.]